MEHAEKSCDGLAKLLMIYHPVRTEAESNNDSKILQDYTSWCHLDIPELSSDMVLQFL